MKESSNARIYKMHFSSVYPLYIQKAEKKGRSKEEVDQIICWLTGYDMPSLNEQINLKKNFEDFFNECPTFNLNAKK